MADEETPKPAAVSIPDKTAKVEGLKRLRAAIEAEAAKAREAEEARPANVLAALRADRAVLDQWIDDLRAPIASTEAAADRVRMASQELVDLPDAQGQARWTKERSLDDLVQDLIEQAGGMHPIGPNDYPEGLRTINGFDLMTSKQVIPPDMDDSIAQTSARGQIQEQIDAIRAVPSTRVPALNADVDAAFHASQRARRTADAAMSLSTRRFVWHRTPWSARAARGAAASFLAFIVVAGVGSMFPPAPLPSLVAIALLVGISVVAAGLLLRDGRGRGVFAAGAVGIALSCFMAAYLAINLIDANAITIDGHPIGFIGEAGLLSLTVAVSGGTIGVSLAGLARVVAFVQILLTVAAVGIALTWGWNRVVARLDEARRTPDNE